MEFGILNSIQSAIILLLDLYFLGKIFLNRIKNTKRRFFVIMALSASIEQLMSFLVRMIKYKVINCNITVQYLIYIVMFIFMAFTAWSAMNYLLYLRNKESKLSPFIRGLMLSPCVIMTIAAISSPWTHWLFYIDSSLTYHRGSLFFLQIFCPYIFALVAVIMMVGMIINRKRNGEEETIRYFLCFIVPAITGAVLQVVLNVDGGYSSIGVSVSVILLYMEFYVEEIKELEHLKDVETTNVMLQEQLKEIEHLNEQLQKNQAQLEGASAEQEAYIEKVTALNEKLSLDQERLILNNEIISSISKLYFAIFRIDLINDFYEEISSDDDVHRLTGHEGVAYDRMMELCDNFVSSEYEKEIREFFNLKTLSERLDNIETIESVYLAKDGNWHQARFISKRRDDNGKTTHVLYVTRLISAEKIKEMEYARKLEEAIKVAENANKAKSSFLFSMSHDIRTPMNAIIGYTDLMERYFDDKEKCTGYLNKIKDSSDFLLSLINNVLEMARIESGQTILDESPANTLEVLEGLKSVYDELMRNKNITFVTNYDVKTPYIYYDKVKVNEIYLNLLSNAYKYTPEGGRVSIDVRELPHEKNEYIYLETIISDTGIGMSKDYLPILFDEFSREHNTTEAKIQGTGLGMPIVKKLVELMGGTITVESELGKGTTFVVTLPHKIAHDAKVIDGNVEVNLQRMDGMRILLAEDNDINAEIATEILQEYGFIIERAEDGIICVDMLSKSEEDYYDLILMDIQMPNMDGYKATRVIRAMDDSYRNNIPIIAMTANAFDEDRQNALNAGMDGHVSKPIEIGILINTINEVFSKEKEELKALRTKANRFITISRAKRYLSNIQSDKYLSVIPGGFFAYMANGEEELIFANEMACKIWGCNDFDELNSFSGGKFSGLIHPDDYTEVNKSIWEQINKGSDDLDQVEYRIIRKDGETRRIMDYGRLIHSDEESNIFYVFVTDITERQN